MSSYQGNDALSEGGDQSTADAWRQRCQQLERQLKARAIELGAEVSKREHLEATLNVSETRYRTLLDASRDAIYMTAPNGTLIEANQAALELFGFSRAESQDLNVRALYVNPDDRAPFLREVEAKGTLRGYKLRMRRKDGTVIDCLLSASVRRDAHGSILGYQGIIEEITEHKRAGLVRSDDSHTLEPQETLTEDIQVQNAQLEDALRQLQGMQQQLITQEKLASLGALTSGVAHEIRNPLNFVNNFAELSTELIQELREELASQPDHLDTQTLEDIEDILFSLEQNVQKITQHGKRADRIVQGMLQHSRGQPGVREPTDINAILEESINLAYHGLRAQDVSFNATLDTAYDTAIGLVNVVPQDISRVLLNIINNAFYATHAKHQEQGAAFSPTLSVRTTNLGNHIEGSKKMPSS